MIVITGPGRSGTSLIAQLYRDLGFDPGGDWVDEIAGGLEASEIVRLNEELLEALGLTPMGSPGGGLGRMRRAGKALVPTRMRVTLRRRLQRMPWMGRSEPAMLRWDRVRATAESFAPRLSSAAVKHEVVKDPRFFWTLPLWARAGIPIEHVLISIRNLDATAESRDRMDSNRFTTEGGIRNSIAYGLGLTIFALEEARIPYSIVRFPDFLDDPSALYRAARFPRPVSEAEFTNEFERLRRPDLVHDQR